MEKQLKPYEHYNKQYDRIVISILKEKEDEQSGNEYQKESVEYLMQEQIKLVIFLHEKQLIVNKRDASILKWMENDRIYDKRIALSPPIAHLSCVKCENGMTALDSDIKNDGRILYLYRCISDKCKSVRSIYTDGEEYVTKVNVCPECSDVLKFKEEKTEHTRIFTDYCPTCDYSESIDFPLKKEKDILTKANRLKYCRLSKNEIDIIDSWKGVQDLVKVMQEAQTVDDIKKMFKLDEIEHLNIPDLEKKLKPAIESNKFEKFQLEKPIITHFVSIEFSVLDTSSRNEIKSKTLLRKLIRNSLLKTNWRLMTTDISFRLGFLTGKLRAYESQEDLIKIGKEILEKETSRK